MTDFTSIISKYRQASGELEQVATDIASKFEIIAKQLDNDDIWSTYLFEKISIDITRERQDFISYKMICRSQGYDIKYNITIEQVNAGYEFHLHSYEGFEEGTVPINENYVMTSKKDTDTPAKMIWDSWYNQ